MATLDHGRVRRVFADLRGDEAEELEILEVMLRMGEVSDTRIDTDTRMVRLAFRALGRVIGEFSARTGLDPTYLMLCKHLEVRNAATQAETTQFGSVRELPGA
jgi:hypothetical protein